MTASHLALAVFGSAGAAITFSEALRCMPTKLDTRPGPISLALAGVCFLSVGVWAVGCMFGLPS